MDRAEMRVWREKLLALRARLRGEVSQLANAALDEGHMKASGNVARMPIHMADLGTDAFEREFTIRLMENDEDTLEQIEASLERIEDGIYGMCDECGARLPKARLEAIPYTTLCVKCASLSERG